MLILTLTCRQNNKCKQWSTTHRSFCCLNIQTIFERFEAYSFVIDVAEILVQETLKVKQRVQQDQQKPWDWNAEFRVYKPQSLTPISGMVSTHNSGSCNMSVQMFSCQGHPPSLSGGTTLLFDKVPRFAAWGLGRASPWLWCLTAGAPECSRGRTWPMTVFENLQDGIIAVC